jgi:uncharacterized protein
LAEFNCFLSFLPTVAIDRICIEANDCCLYQGEKMLELRPTCEHCNKALPPDSTEAMICSFECTFCRDCTVTVLGNVCPNCGGGFCARPVRPARDWKGENFLGKYPASTAVKYRPADRDAHAWLVEEAGKIPPEKR